MKILLLINVEDEFSDLELVNLRHEISGLVGVVSVGHAPDLAALQAVADAARELVGTHGVIHRGAGWSYYKVKAEELDALKAALAQPGDRTEGTR
jgi:hypothetical protein